MLRQEALQAQSAQIDLISGATYTSEGYSMSLQSALDQLGQVTGAARTDTSAGSGIVVSREGLEPSTN